MCMCTFYYFLHIWRMSLNFLNKLKMWILVFKVNLATLFCWLSNRPMVYGRQLCNLRSCWVPQLVWTLMFFRTENMSHKRRRSSPDVQKIKKCTHTHVFTVKKCSALLCCKSEFVQTSSHIGGQWLCYK